MNQYPEIKVIYSKVYARTIYKLLNKNLTDFEEFWEKIKEHSTLFENYLKIYQTRILELIPKYTGNDWPESARSVIYVYPVKGIPSFSHPLTLNVREDPVLTLGIFIHELTHNNTYYFGFPSEEVMERTMNTIAIKVLKDLFLKADSYYSFAVEIFEKRFNSKFSTESKLDNKTVKDYLKELTSK